MSKTIDDPDAKIHAFACSGWLYLILVGRQRQLRDFPTRPGISPTGMLRCLM